MYKPSIFASLNCVFNWEYV